LHGKGTGTNEPGTENRQKVREEQRSLGTEEEPPNRGGGVGKVSFDKGGETATEETCHTLDQSAKVIGIATESKIGPRSWGVSSERNFHGSPNCITSL